MNTLKSLRKILGKLLLFAGVIFELILLFVRSYDPNTENYSDVFGNIVHSPDFFLGRLLSPIINLFSFHGLLFVGGILVLYVGYRLISAEEKVNTIIQLFQYRQSKIPTNNRVFSVVCGIY